MREINVIRNNKTVAKLCIDANLELSAEMQSCIKMAEEEEKILWQKKYLVS